jgi:hypothetical protein
MLNYKYTLAHMNRNICLNNLKVSTQLASLGATKAIFSYMLAGYSLLVGLDTDITNPRDFSRFANMEVMCYDLNERQNIDIL